jgi:tetratricopeptide (TPR) repeat protein
MKNNYLAFAVSLLLLCGCQSESDKQQHSKTAQQRQSTDPNVAKFLVRAQDAFSQRAYNEALALADSAEGLAPHLADAPFLRGLIFTELRRYKEAEEAYNKVLSLDPYYQGVWLNLGSTALRRGDARKALSLYQKELKTYPTSAALHQIGRVYASLGKADSARHAYEQAIVLDSTFATAYLRLAELYKEGGELDRALRYARQGLALQPDNLNYRYFIGSLLLLNGQVQEAVVELEAVVAKRPWHYWANYNLGQAFVRLGRQDEGKRYLAKAESLQAELKNVQDWENLVENNPDQLMLWVNYGEALRRAGRIEEAIEAYQVAISLEPRFVALQNNLAIMYLMQGDTSIAVSQYMAILEQYPFLNDVWLNLGAVYANSGNVEAARKAWETGLQYAPEDSTLKAYLARLPRKS